MQWADGVTYFGSTAFKGRPVTFGIKDSDRLEHLYILGKAGTDRAALLSRMILQDLERGVGTVILDGSGTLAQTILERIPQGEGERLIFLDPSDGEFPFSWNAVEDIKQLPESMRLPLLSRMLASVYRFSYGIFSDTLAAILLAKEKSTIVTVYELATNADFRKKLFDDDAEKVRFEKLLEAEKDAVELIGEHGRYIAKDTLVRNVVGQTESKFSFAGLPGGTIVLFDLSRIKMFPTRITPVIRIALHVAHAHALNTNAAIGIYAHDCLRYFSEEDIDFLFPDHTLAFTISDTIYSEEDKPIREKAIARSASLVAFTPHQIDTQFTDRMLYPYVESDELFKLESGECAVALAINGVRSRPFFAKILPLTERSGISQQDLIGQSRAKYTLPRMKADQLFKRDEADDEALAQKGKPESSSFSDTFRSIFAKRATDQTPALDKPAVQEGTKVPAAPAPDAPQKPAPQTPGAGSKPAEIPEDELRGMLYVDRESF